MGPRVATGVERVGIGRDQLEDALRAAGDRIAFLIRYLPDTGVRVPGSEWTVGDTAAHIVLGHRLYTRLLRGGDSPFTGRDSFFTDGKARSSVNASVLPALPERDGAVLADLVVAATAGLLDAAATSSPTRAVRWHWAELPLGSFVCVALMHALGHGYDIARGLRRRFPVGHDEALLALEGVLAVMPLFVDREAARGLRACLQIRVRRGPRVWLVFDDGDVTVHRTRPGRRVDCSLSAEPVALFLVALGRRSQWWGIARGKLVAWGRKPWLALQLTSLFPTPG